MTSTTSTHPLVSVVVTTYNQASYIEPALNSVFAQTYRPIEVIVVDDGSSDDTLVRIARFGGQVVYVRQRNAGIAASRNTGIHRARGTLLAFLDGDDMWEPQKLSLQTAVAERNPEAGLIVANGVEFDSCGIRRASLLPGELFGGSAVVTRYSYDKLLSLDYPICTTSQVMIPRHVFQSVGLSDTRFRLASDYDLYLRIAAKYPIAFLENRLTRWRYHPTSASGPGGLRGLRYAEDRIGVYRKHLGGASSELRGLIRCRIQETIRSAAQDAYYYGRRSDRKRATRQLLRLMMRNPRCPAVVSFLVGLWCPESVAIRIGPSIRKLLGVGIAGRP